MLLLTFVVKNINLTKNEFASVFKGLQYLNIYLSVVGSQFR